MHLNHVTLKGIKIQRASDPRSTILSIYTYTNMCSVLIYVNRKHCANRKTLRRVNTIRFKRQK